MDSMCEIKNLPLGPGPGLAKYFQPLWLAMHICLSPAVQTVVTEVKRSSNNFAQWIRNCGGKIFKFHFYFEAQKVRHVMESSPSTSLPAHTFLIPFSLNADFESFIYVCASFVYNFSIVHALDGFVDYSSLPFRSFIDAEIPKSKSVVSFSWASTNWKTIVLPCAHVTFRNITCTFPCSSSKI